MKKGGKDKSVVFIMLVSVFKTVILKYRILDFYFEIAISLCGSVDVRVCSETKEKE